MEIELTLLEARILGAFIEKELTTPDYYPLSSNALTNACNQKSNRNPVLQLSETEVLDGVETLRKKGLAMQSQDAGSRVSKFRHALRERLYLEDQELAILAELLLRGAQTPGELRARCERMASFNDLDRLDQVMQELLDKEPPMVIKLARQPGHKEQRYMHLLCGPVEEDELLESRPAMQSAPSAPIAALEESVRQLQAEMAELQAEFKKFREQFE